MSILGIIPARFHSTRLPGKPLLDIAGKSMIQRVYEQVQKATQITTILVATDTSAIADHVSEFGGNAMLTRTDHPSGTSRCSEVAQKLSQYSHIINIQGDEPFILPAQIDQLVEILKDSTANLATLAKPIKEEKQLFNTNVVKVVTDQQQNALYFSRQAIPFFRDLPPADWCAQSVHYQHLGIYGYDRNTLLSLSQLAPHPIEHAEKLEQLRWLAHGFKVKVGITTLDSMGIDTPEDLALAITFARAWDRNNV